MFCRSLFVLLSFFVYCVVCPFSTYGFWLSVWCLQYLLIAWNSKPKISASFVSWLNWYFSRHIGCKSINCAMHKNDILMIRIGIIGSNAKKNNKEYVDFIVFKRIASVNIINRNKMQLYVYNVQVHVYFSVLVKLIQGLLLRQKSQFFRHYITSRYHTILTRLFFKMFSLHVLEICEHM